MELVAIVLITLILAPIAILTEGTLRSVLGLVVLHFFPGYTLLAAFLPKKRDLNGLERVALSLGLSIALVPLIGIVLDRTVWGIDLYPFLFILSLFIVATAAVAFWRRRRLPEEARFGISLTLQGVRSSLRSRTRDRREWLLWGLLAVVLLGAMAGIFYEARSAMGERRATQFYFLGEGGWASNYPTELILGEEGTVALSIVNYEQEAADFRVEVALDGERIKVIGPFSVGRGEKWQQPVSFRAVKAGLNQKVEFLLYKGEVGRAYRSLHLWVDVSGK